MKRQELKEKRKRKHKKNLTFTKAEIPLSSCSRSRLVGRSITSSHFSYSIVLLHGFTVLIISVPAYPRCFLTSLVFMRVWEGRGLLFVLPPSLLAAHFTSTSLHQASRTGFFIHLELRVTGYAYTPIASRRFHAPSLSVYSGGLRNKARKGVTGEQGVPLMLF